MDDEFKKIIEIFILSLIIFLNAYLILYIVFPFSLELHIITIFTTTILLYLILIFKRQLEKFMFIFFFILIGLFVLEETLFVTDYVNYGFIVNASLFLSMPIFAFFNQNQAFRRILELLALALISRTILIAFPLGFLNFSGLMPAIYSFMIIALVIYMRLRNISNEEVRLKIGKKSITEQLAIGILVGASIGIVEYLILNLKVTINYDFLNFIAMLIFIMLLVGIGEELMFRGLLQTTMEKIMPKWQALLIVNFLFGAMHIGWLNPVEIIFAYSAGMIFGILAYYYDSLISPITAHTLGNIVLFSIAYLNV